MNKKTKTTENQFDQDKKKSGTLALMHAISVADAKTRMLRKRMDKVKQSHIAKHKVAPGDTIHGKKIEQTIPCFAGLKLVLSHRKAYQVPAGYMSKFKPVK